MTKTSNFTHGKKHKNELGSYWSMTRGFKCLYVVCACAQIIRKYHIENNNSFEIELSYCCYFLC